MKRRLALLAGLSFAASAFADSSSNDGMASTYVRPARGALILLVFEDSQDALLARGGTQLQQQLKSQLAAAGYRFAVLDNDDFRALEAKVSGSPGEQITGRLANSTESTRWRTLSPLARIARDNSGCDLVLRARLVWRDAGFDALVADWDGQRRGVALEGGDDVKNRAGANAHIRGVWMRGRTKAVSVELVAFDGTGTPAFGTFGGAFVPWIWNMSTRTPRLRDDLFQGDGDVADGVKIALAPLR